MKITFVLLALVSLVGALFAQDAPSPAKAEESKDLVVTTIAVPTIQCSMCVNTITKALKADDGVSAVEVNLDEKTTTVEYDQKKTDLKRLEKAIAATGYDANDTKRDPKAYDKLSPCCKMDE